MDWRPKNSTPSLEDSFASLCRFRTGLRTPNDLFRPKELFSTLCGHPRNRVRQQHDISLGGMLSEAFGGSRRLSEALGGSRRLQRFCLHGEVSWTRTDVSARPQRRVRHRVAPV
jgi:hypothetical protein